MEGEEFNWVSQGWGGSADRHKHANLSKVNKGRTVTCTHSRPQQGFSNACCVLDTVLGLRTGPGFLLLEAGKVFKLIHEVECENGNQNSARAESDRGGNRARLGRQEAAQARHGERWRERETEAKGGHGIKLAGTMWIQEQSTQRPCYVGRALCHLLPNHEGTAGETLGIWAQREVLLRMVWETCNPYSSLGSHYPTLDQVTAKTTPGFVLSWGHLYRRAP